MTSQLTKKQIVELRSTLVERLYSFLESDSSFTERKADYAKVLSEVGTELQAKVDEIQNERDAEALLLVNF